MLIDIIEDASSLAALKNDWQAVYEADPEAQCFLSWAWLSTWLERCDGQWFVLAAKPSAGSRHVAFFPLQLRTELDRNARFYNSIRMAGYYFAGYTGFICDPAFQNAAIPAFAERIKTMNWATLHLDTVRASPERLMLLTQPFSGAPFVTRRYARRDTGDATNYSIYPYVNLPETIEAYLDERLGPANRKNARLSAPARRWCLAGHPCRCRHIRARSRNASAILGDQVGAQLQ
jgi:hypothetical protein